MSEPDRQTARQSRVAAEVAAHLARHGGGARTDADAPGPDDGKNPRDWSRNVMDGRRPK